MQLSNEQLQELSLLQDKYSNGDITKAQYNTLKKEIFAEWKDVADNPSGNIIVAILILIGNLLTLPSMSKFKVWVYGPFISYWIVLMWTLLLVSCWQSSQESTTNLVGTGIIQKVVTEESKTVFEWNLTGSYITWWIIRIQLQTSLKDSKFAVRMKTKNYTSIYDANGNYIDKAKYFASPNKWMYDSAFDHNNSNDTNGLCDISESPFQGTVCQKRDSYELITPEQYKSITTFEKREWIDEALLKTDSVWSGILDVYPYYPAANAFSCDSDDELRLAQKFQVWAALSQKCYLLSEWTITVDVVIPLTAEYTLSDVSIEDGNGTTIPSILWTTNVSIPPNCTISNSSEDTVMICPVSIKIDAHDIEQISDIEKNKRMTNSSNQAKTKKFLKEIEDDKTRLKSSEEYQERARTITEARSWARKEYYSIANVCESKVLEALISPKTAEFPARSESNIHFNDDKIRYNSYVDSQNAYGAIVRSNYRCDVESPMGNRTDAISASVELY
jgi:hypothetical protein